jgi:BlaI family transcriptional regulator, penicillinase repressor
MARKPAAVTETEYAILDVLWRREPCTIREIVETIYSKHTPALHATVKSLLDRLSDKGFIRCDTSAFMHRFSAQVTRQEYVVQELENLADSHFGGAFTPLLLSLVDKAKLTRKDRDTIRKIIESIPESK